MTSEEFPSAVPEIPVGDVIQAVSYYENCLGFQRQGGVDGGFGQVCRGSCRIFLTDHAFREHYGPMGAPVVIWLNLNNKKIVSKPESKPWHLHEFTAADPDGNLAQEPKLTARDSDREQINAILRGVEEAWNHHDMGALANLFHEDGVWILWTGHLWTGRKAIEEGHAEVHRTVFRNSIQREQLEELTFVGPDAAVVRYCSTLTGDERAPEKLIRSRKIMVMTRREGGWKIGWGQNTRFADSVPDAPACSKPKH